MVMARLCPLSVLVSVSVVLSARLQMEEQVTAMFLFLGLQED